MGVNSGQIAMNASTPTAIFVKGTSTGQFDNIQGNASNPLPTIIQNMDATNTVYLGGPGVTTANGFPLIAGASLPIEWLGTDATSLFGISSTGTPKIAILAANQ